MKQPVTPVTRDELDVMFAKLDARIAERFNGLSDGLVTAVENLGASSIEAQRLAGEQQEAAEVRGREAPLAQLREKLTAHCYTIRLRAACENPTVYTPGDHRTLALCALADADAVIEMLAQKP